MHGVVTAEGLFDGTVVTASDEIFIEPASRYSPLICHVQNNIMNRVRNQPHHTIAYRSTDISMPTDVRQPCASELLRQKQVKNIE